ncbi:MAG: hypothetical protein IJO79_01590, partial [Firmicutes bacterium]|nr:hypothetical protein [Bacillota bacterium]
MKRILRTSLAFLLTFTLILGSFSGLAFGATASSPGENSWWDYRAESFSDFNGSTATLTIHTPQELALFSYICSNPTDYYWPYQTVRLGSNISLYGHQWEPIYSDYRFTFDGNGYAIYGMTITEAPEITTSDWMVDTAYLGLFGNGRGVTIQNLNMRNVKIDIDLPADGYLSGYVLECGAIAGWAADVINCFAQVDMNFDTGYEIGVAGIVADANIVKDCVTRGTLTVNAAGGFVAGVAGEVNSCQKCTNYASINASGLNAGGVFGIGGYASYSESPAATGCKNYGDIVISGTNRYVGGVGYMVEFGKVSLCHNNGTIGNVSSSDYLTAGGIIGMTKSDNSIVISDCKSHGAITLIGDQTYAGGVVGHLNEGFWASDSENAFKSGCAQVTSC